LIAWVGGRGNLAGRGLKERIIEGIGANESEWNVEKEGGPHGMGNMRYP